LYKDQPVYDIQTMEEVIARSVGARRFAMTLLSVFAGLAMALSSVGVYGVILYSVAQRTHEFGVRIAMGARERDVLKLVFKQGMKLVLIGVAIGLCASFALTRLVESLLFGVSAKDPLTFAIGALLLTMVAMLACWVPARRATKVDPLVALRCE
jgi:putative ABC transport system permease protein